MGNIPSDRNGLLTFARGHFEVWIANDASLGLLPSQPVEVKNAVTAIEAKLTANAALKAQLKTATRELSEMFAELRRATGSCVRTINDFALTQPDPDAIYNLAQIDPPQPRGNSLPPAQPFDLRCDLDLETGALVLRWKASNPAGVSGVVYFVRRGLDGATQLTQVGVSGNKSFLDATVPVGTQTVTYQVFGQRGGLQSPMSPALTVRLFVLPGGGMAMETVSVMQAA